MADSIDNPKCKFLQFVGVAQFLIFSFMKDQLVIDWILVNRYKID